MKPETSGWSPETDEIIRKAAARGGTASETAVDLATAGIKKSRSAVLGRAHRIGVRFPPKVPMRGRTDTYANKFRLATPEDLAPKPAAERKGGTKLAKASREFNPPVAVSHETPEQRLSRAASDRLKHFAAMERMAEKQPGVPFMERRQLQCVAMFGTGMHANCCGRPVTYRPDGNLSSYCAEHHKAYHSYTPRAPSKLDFTDAGVMKVKVKKPDSEDAENQEELEPVDRLIAGDEDDDTQQAA